MSQQQTGPRQCAHCGRYATRNGRFWFAPPPKKPEIRVLCSPCRYERGLIFDDDGRVVDAVSWRMAAPLATTTEAYRV
jgi:hypothetical protein